MQPRISIVTSSYNQGQFIEQTIKSVLEQNYPEIEHIIIDGLSTDNTVEVLARYPHLKIIREKDRGQADAINKGLKLATGEILCFLNSDDTLAPNTLHRVAKELAPSQGRHIIMGRCRYIDEQGLPTGIEHPSFFLGHLRVLKIWKSHGIPQPAVFWSRAVMERCGMLNPDEQLVLDYELFCRFSRHYDFHFVDQIFANYRLHQSSKTCSSDDNYRFKESIRASKQYWGPPLSLKWLQLWASYLNFKRKTATLAHLKKAMHSFRSRRLLPFFYHAGMGGLLAPGQIYCLTVGSWLRRIFKVSIPNIERHAQKMQRRYPQIMAYFQYTHIWEDQWAGPVCSVPVPEKATKARIQGKIPFLAKKIELTILMDDRILLATRIQDPAGFDLQFDLPAVTKNRKLKILAQQWFILEHYIGCGDLRPLSWKCLGIHFC